jgi:hypothetical protein
VRDQAIEHGIGGREPSEPVTEPIGPVGPLPRRSNADERGGWRAVVRDHVAFALVLGVTVVGIVLLVQYHWIRGAVAIGGALLLAAFFRLVVPERRAALLAVRGRPVDVLSYGVLGACIVFVATTIARGPLG